MIKHVSLICLLSLFVSAIIGCQRGSDKAKAQKAIFQELEYQVAPNAPEVMACFSKPKCLVYEVGGTQYYLEEMMQQNKPFAFFAQKVKDFTSNDDDKLLEIKAFIIQNQAFQASLEIASLSYRNIMLLKLAKKSGLSFQDFINGVAPLESFKRSEEEWANEFEKRKINTQGLSEQQIKNLKLAVQLEEQQKKLSAHISAQSDLPPLVFHIKKPILEFKETAEHSIGLGSPQSAIKIDFFDNFRCPECKDLFVKLFDRYHQKIHFRFHFMSTHMSPIQEMVASAAFCVYEQGPQEFLNFYYDYAGQVSPFVENEMVESVKRAQVDIKEWNKCRFSRKYNDIIEYQLKFSQYMGLITMPALLVNGQVHFGIIDTDQLFAEIDRIKPPAPASFWQKIKLFFSNLF